MKRRPIPQQFEMPFTASAFNLAGQSEKSAAPEGVKILAEMTESEREAIRVAQEPCQEEIEITREIEAKKQSALERSGRIAANRFAMGGGHVDEDRTPGLAPGSYWSTEKRPMAKALANMQG